MDITAFALSALVILAIGVLIFVIRRYRIAEKAQAERERRFQEELLLKYGDPDAES
jgi:hypothetical protein